MKFVLFRKKFLVGFILLCSVCLTLHQTLVLFSRKQESLAVRQAISRWTMLVEDKTPSEIVLREAPKTQLAITTTLAMTQQTTYDAAAIKERFLRRKMRADLVCPKFQQNFRQARNRTAQAGPALRNMIGSVEKQAVLCYTLKAGSSTWHDIFWHFREPDVADTEPFFGRAVYGNEKHFKTLSSQQRRKLFTDPNTVKLMTIRHPFTRLISGWEDKFNKEYYYDVLFKRHPKMKDYPSEYGKWNGTGQWMPWKSFIEYMADYGPMDEHFRTTPCDVCTFPYDYIIKMETFASSSEWLLKEKLNCTHSRKRNISNGTRMDPVEKIKTMYSVLDRGRLEKLEKLFHREMEIHGYTFDINTLTAGGWDD